MIPVYRREVAQPPAPVYLRLLDAFGEAGITDRFAVVKADKADLRRSLEADDVPVLSIPDSPSSAFTVSCGTRAVGPATVAVGFPDVLWEGDQAFARMLETLERTGADAVLGLFPPAPDYPTDAVEVGRGGEVRGFRPASPDHPTWTLAVWRADMSRFLEGVVDARYMHPDGPTGTDTELGMTDVFVAALDAGYRVHSVRVSDVPFLDIGDPDRLAEARRRAELEAP